MLTAQSPRPLTVRQQEVLEAIRSFYRANGFPPTFRILMGLIGVGNTNAVMCHLKPLVKKGALRRINAGVATRYIPATDEGRCPCCGKPI
jgi:repressor LexA